MQFWLRDRKDGRIIRLISFDYFTASLCIVTHDETRFINIHLNASCLLLSPSFNIFLSKKIWSVVRRRVIHLTAGQRDSLDKAVFIEKRKLLSSEWSEKNKKTWLPQRNSCSLMVRWCFKGKWYFFIFFFQVFFFPWRNYFLSSKINLFFQFIFSQKKNLKFILSSSRYANWMYTHFHKYMYPRKC